jgi:hypothetical protein
MCINFFVSNKASCCTTWVLGDWPMFGDGPVFLSTFVGTVSVLFRHSFLLRNLVCLFCLSH